MEQKIDAPTSPHLFPLPQGAVESYFATFAGFDADQLNFIEGSNIGLADPTDIAYPLLNLHTAPELLAQLREGHPRAESRVRAFRAGACMGLAIVRGRMDTLAAETDEALPPLMFDPRKEYGWSGEHDDTAQTLNFIDYLKDETLALHLTHTRLSWLGKMDFTTMLGIESGDDKYINVGLLHAFALANAVEGQPPVAHHELTFAFDPAHHFSIADRLGSWNGGWRVEQVGIEFDERELREGLPDLTPFLRHRLRSGYRAHEVEPAMVDDGRGGVTMQTDERGTPVMRRHHNPFTPDPDIWGSGEVPAYRQLTNVRRFESAFVMVDPVGSTELMEVGFKKSAQEFELQKDDVVILRGRKGNFYALPHPFVIPPQATDPDNHCMELFALCRKGQSVYLRDVSNLARPDVDYLHDWLRMITERQQRLARHHRGFGRTMLHAFPLFGLPFLTAYLVQENGPGDLLQRQGAGVGSGVALGVLLTYFNHRRQHPRQLSTGRNAGTRP